MITNLSYVKVKKGMARAASYAQLIRLYTNRFSAHYSGTGEQYALFLFRAKMVFAESGTLDEDEK